MSLEDGSQGSACFISIKLVILKEKYGFYKEKEEKRHNIMKAFFVYQSEIPQGAGFHLFGAGHILWIAGVMVFAVIFSLWYAKKDSELQNRIDKIISVYLLSSGVARDVVLAVKGHFTVGFLPLHLCSLALFIAMIYSFTRNRFWGIVYLLLCLPGAVGALLFPNWTAYPFFTYMNIHAFISHGLLITFGIMQFLSARLVLAWRDLWIPACFGIAGVAVIYPLNQYFDTNFWFINRPSAGSPLVMIAELVGMDFYLPAYFAFCMLIIFLWLAFLKGVQWIRYYVN